MHRHYGDSRSEAGAAERLVPAMVLIGIGALFLLNNLHIVYFREITAWWPVILIAFGMVKLVDSPHQGGRVGGGVLVVAGGLFLARNLGYLDIRTRDLWPLVLIGVGVWMLIQRTTPDEPPSAEGAPATGGTYTGDTLKEQAVFSGGKRRIVTPDFRGGKVEAVFGGYDLDFTRAGMVGNSAVLKVDAVFGGVEIRIPPNWNVEMQGTGVFGGFSDETLHPDPAHHPDIKQLIVKGGAVFGGVVVKN